MTLLALSCLPGSRLLPSAIIAQGAELSTGFCAPGGPPLLSRHLQVAILFRFGHIRVQPGALAPGRSGVPTASGAGATRGGNEAAGRNTIGAMAEIRPIEWLGDRVRLLDQVLLPGEVRYIETDDWAEVAQAINNMKIRGAPAIGVAAAFGAALAAMRSSARTTQELLGDIERCAEALRGTRPTGRNLFWALDRVVAAARRSQRDIREAVIAEALSIQREDLESCRRIGDFGAALLPQSATVLTHCNAGALATAGYGTALGVIRSAVRSGKQIQVMVAETRPLLQGARLTAWELRQEGIPYTIVSDTAVGHCMQQGRVEAVIVGADRIAANGDAANKIGTYSVSVLAKEHDVPFYAAAPISTLDLSLDSGNAIPIEQRPAEEVLYFAGRAVAPEGSTAFNPAFDVTPARNITAIITDRGVATPPYRRALRALASQAAR